VWFLSKLITVTFLLVWCGSDSLTHVSNFLIQVIQVISTNKHERGRQQSRYVTSTATHASHRRRSREDDTDHLIPCTLRSNTNAESPYETATRATIMTICKHNKLICKLTKANTSTLAPSLWYALSHVCVAKANTMTLKNRVTSIAIQLLIVFKAKTIYKRHSNNHHSNFIHNSSYIPQLYNNKVLSKTIECTITKAYRVLVHPIVESRDRQCKQGRGSSSQNFY
jgi:flagellar biosynthesis regulator FlaF